MPDLKPEPDTDSAPCKLCGQPWKEHKDADVLECIRLLKKAAEKPPVPQILPYYPPGVRKTTDPVPVVPSIPQSGVYPNTNPGPWVNPVTYGGHIEDAHTKYPMLFNGDSLGRNTLS